MLKKQIGDTLISGSLCKYPGLFFWLEIGSYEYSYQEQGVFKTFKAYLCLFQFGGYISVQFSPKGHFKC